MVNIAKHFGVAVYCLVAGDITRNQTCFTLV